MSSGKVLLVNPNQMKPVVAPIGLDYVGEALKEAGYEVDVLDLAFSRDPEASIARYFAFNSVDAVGVTVRNTDDCYYASQDFIIPKVKTVIAHIKARTDAPLVLGGVGFSLMPERILRYCDVDLGICGEGEVSFPKLLARLGNVEDYGAVSGLVYRIDGEFKRNPQWPLDPSQLPHQRRDVIDNPRYFREGGMGGIETKRGCEGRCIYCADPLSKGTRIRLRPPDQVAGEVEALLEKGVDHLHICDSEFNLPIEHAEAVCQEMIKRGLGDKVRWYTYASPIPFSDELAGLMKRAGCVGIDFGVDSGDDGMLHRLGRDFSREEIMNTARICHRQGMIFMYDLLLGGPGEDEESIRATIETMKEASPSRIGVSIGVRIYPGSALASIVGREGITRENPNLHGRVEGNEDFFFPIFYISSKVGKGITSYVARLVGGDERFFFATEEEVDRNYNYNENSVLVEAIKKGYRGAFWDILRRISEEPSE